MRPDDLELVEQTHQGDSPVGDSKRVGGIRRRTRAGCVPGDHVEAARKTSELRPPYPRVAQEPVQKYEGLALARLYAIKRSSISR
jgi:hypothetical protein